MFKFFLKYSKPRTTYLNLVRNYAKKDVSSQPIGREFLKDYQTLRIKNIFPEAKYGGTTMVSLLVGQDSSADYVRAIYDQIRAPVKFEKIKPLDDDSSKCSKSAGANDDDQNKLDQTILSIFRNRYALILDVYHDFEKKLERRRLNLELELFAAVYEYVTVPCFRAKFDNVNLTCIIQNRSNLMEYEPVKGVVENLMISSLDYNRRFVKYAFDYAVSHKRKKITFCHKEVYFWKSDGLTYLKAVSEYKKEYPQIEVETKLVDTVAIDLLFNPQDYDVICCEYRFGLMVSSICCGICGGPGIYSSYRIGEHHCVLHPVSSDIPMSVDEKELSPYGVIKCAADLLMQMGQCECGNKVAQALQTTMEKGIRTKEYGGCDSSDDVVCDVLSNLHGYQCPA